MMTAGASRLQLSTTSPRATSVTKDLSSTSVPTHTPASTSSVSPGTHRCTAACSELRRRAGGGQEGFVAPRVDLGCAVLLG